VKFNDAPTVTGSLSPSTYCTTTSPPPPWPRGRQREEGGGGSLQLVRTALPLEVEGGGA